jgi:hypothetical protein
MSRDRSSVKGASSAWAPSRDDLSSEPRVKPAGRWSAGDGQAMADGWERHVLSEEAEDMEIDPEELREFLAADLLEVKADPVFKEKLRQKLWRIVSMRRTPTPSDQSE